MTFKQCYTKFSVHCQDCEWGQRHFKYRADIGDRIQKHAEAKDHKVIAYLETKATYNGRQGKKK